MAEPAPSIDEVMKRDDEFRATAAASACDPVAEASALREIFEGGDLRLAPRDVAAGGLTLVCGMHRRGKQGSGAGSLRAHAECGALGKVQRIAGRAGG